MDRTSLFRAHVESVMRTIERALETFSRHSRPIDGVVFHAGTPRSYHADDQQMPFRSIPHFLRLAPVPGPHHLLEVRGSWTRPRLLRVVPKDYWYEPPAVPDHPYAEILDVHEVDSPEAAVEAVEQAESCAYFGNDPQIAEKLGIPRELVEPDLLASLLDWDRGLKTPYELDCIEEACRIAARGHVAVRDAAEQGATERELDAVYLRATGMQQLDTPYGNIIGWDEHAAILHYESKRAAPPEHGQTLLIDAGASAHFYASDITRTYAPGNAPAAFLAALDRMDDLERELVDRVGPGVSFIRLHEEAHQGVARILSDLRISRLSPEATFDRGLTRAFFPHGLGHHLGLQVHDVGGRQKTPEGDVEPPPEAFPHLRTTRELAAGHVVTIEPGLYFIPLLLDPLREKHASDLDWKLVDELVPCGGIRVEDDIHVTESGRRDLTRDLVPGHRDRVTS